MERITIFDAIKLFSRAISSFKNLKVGNDVKMKHEQLKEVILPD